MSEDKMILELLEMFEEIARDKNIQEIHVMIQEVIEKAKSSNIGVDMERVVEFFYLIERYLVERAKKKAIN